MPRESFFLGAPLHTGAGSPFSSVFRYLGEDTDLSSFLSYLSQISLNLSTSGNKLPNPVFI